MANIMLETMVVIKKRVDKLASAVELWDEMISLLKSVSAISLVRTSFSPCSHVHFHGMVFLVYMA